jgi:hypothetical protein
MKMIRVQAAGPAAAAALGLATLGLTACGSGHPAWCGQNIKVTIGYSQAPSQTIRVPGSRAGRLSEIVSGAVLGGSLSSSGNGTANALVLTVPADFPALIRRDTASFNRSGDQFMLLPLGLVWKNDYQRECR